MAHNIDSMAYVGEVPWHRLGAKVPAGINAEEMIRASGLDWTVVKKPVGRAQPAQRFVLVRKARGPAEVDLELGVVSGRYEPLQNTEAFRFFDPFIQQGVAFFETAGSLGDGGRVWVLARLPGQIEVVPGDEVSRYLLLSNSHDGRGAVTIKFTPIRVVCQNTLILATKEGEKGHLVRHSKKAMPLRLGEVAQMAGLFQSTFDEAAASFRAMARVQMTAQRLEEYLEALFPRTDKQALSGDRPDRWGRVTEVFENPARNGLTGHARHSLWGAYNAVTYVEDYRSTEGKTRPTADAAAALADARLNRVWFGTGADLKLKALETGLKLAANWQ